MITNLYRIIKFGIQGFLRNKWLTTATLSVIVLTLFVFVNLILFNVLTNNAISLLRDKIDISVYFNEDVLEDDILELERSLESLSEVKVVEYVSRDRALELFKERHEGDETIVQALSVLDDNPLSASLNIKANDPEDYPIISAYLNNENLDQIVDQITYNQNQLVINRLAKVVNTVRRAGVALTSILTLIAILITLNTIILTIYATREEIGVMRLVGAANKFIRGPYIVQGVLYGVIGAILSLLIALPLISVASPYIGVLMPEMDLQGYFYSNIVLLFGYQLMFGIGLGVISSSIAVGKYLNI
ncbi:hypothetical protein COU49_00980 [Candidatus Nomurabacteria bacterium CG10_big_fil_rev_8_21_14_0_10_35_16]|uniref:Cell division protein FtsX n=1 Tax=Candidatus Nomurabacteria bacterium CG10_big_fil_rev_8_21_14_0_10_35_16 TaxID=1974731 RepID=A0A2H0TBP2_9BACT|nr:MAG: hypothetical protein COU49_00980 [Candidatus Nomurabacteria bacterium CG10_big_fil_rev_8_21_14_0_10_35_16]